MARNGVKWIFHVASVAGEPREGYKSDDYWAAGGLALTAALNGNKRTAFDAVEKFVSCATSPNAAAYQACIQTLNEPGQLDTPPKELLLEVKALLEKKRPDG